MNYKKYPRLEKALNGYFYLYYVDADGAASEGLCESATKLRAQAKFVKLLRDVDRGVLGFHAVLHAIPFPQAVQRYLEQGTNRLREASLVAEQGVVRYVTHHGLRHSYARYLRKSGETLETISKLLGHKNLYYPDHLC